MGDLPLQSSRPDLQKSIVESSGNSNHRIFAGNTRDIAKDVRLLCHRISDLPEACMVFRGQTTETDKAKMETEMGLGDLCPDLVQCILSRVPLKCRTRLKCASKSWCSFITHIRHSVPPATSSGLVLFFRNSVAETTVLHETTFLCVNDHGKKCTLHSSFRHRFPIWLVDSCNGLLLFCAKDEDCTAYFVCGPVLKQWLALPRGHKNSRAASASLVFNESLLRHHFKVICLFWDEVDTSCGTINYQIFSSQTWEWQAHQARIYSSYLLLDASFSRSEFFFPSLFHKGKLYWIWSVFLLVYDDEQESFNLTRLPEKSLAHSVYRGRLLWESDGHLHYCDSCSEGFFIWTNLVDNEKHDCKSADHGWMWRLKQCVKFDELKELNVDIFRMAEEMVRQNLVEVEAARIKWGHYTIRPCAFDEDLQILYLQLPGIILSYSFETRTLAKTWSYGMPGKNYHICRIRPFQFNPVNLPSRDKCWPLNT